MIRQILGSRVILAPQLGQFSKLNRVFNQSEVLNGQFAWSQSNQLTQNNFRGFNQVKFHFAAQKPSTEIVSREIEEFGKNLEDEDAKEYAKNVNLNDFNAFQAEFTAEQREQGKAWHKYNDKGQKVIFQAEVRNYHVLRYQILAGIFGAYFLYLFYLGDAKYKTILAVPAIAYGFFLLSKHNMARRNIPVVRNILLNKDNSYEVLIERNRVLSKIENVQAQNIKIHYTAKRFFDIPFGLAEHQGYKCTINDQPAALPYEYVGNGRDFQRILNNVA